MNTKIHLKTVLKFLGFKTLLFVFFILLGFAPESFASIPNLDYKYSYHPKPIVIELKHQAKEGSIPVYFRKGNFLDADIENKAVFDNSLKGMAHKTDLRFTDSSTFGFIMKPRFNIGFTHTF